MIYSKSTDMVFVKGGMFEMGNQNDASEHWELPFHRVTLSDYYIGKYEVTQLEWAKYMPAETYYKGSGDNYAVYYVSWEDILVYCNKRSVAEKLTPCYSLNDTTDPQKWEKATKYYSKYSQSDSAVCNWNANGYRLPTEAEWEYAAQGGIHNKDNFIYSGSNDIDEVAWYYDNNGSYNSVDYGIKPVGKKLPNKLGIYDMSGNLEEFCWDISDICVDERYYEICNDLGIVTNPTGTTNGHSRIVRGGNWMHGKRDCRVTDRSDDSSSANNEIIGFRVVRRP